MKHFIAYFNYPNQSIELDADSFEVSLDEGIVKFLDNNKDIISIVTIKDLLVVKKVSS